MAEHVVATLDRHMVHQTSRPNGPAALLDDERDVLLSATCPMCHTHTSLTRDAIAAGGGWQCVRCGQHWNASRLAAVAAYAAWVADRDRVGTRPLEGSQDAAMYGSRPASRKDGTP